MRLDSPWLLLVVVLVPLLLVAAAAGRRSASLRFSSLAPIRALRRTWRQRLLWLPLALRAATLTLLAVALARPQAGKSRVEDASEGIAIEMLVDRSGSMGTEFPFQGEQLNRLEVVKRIFQEFVLGNERNLAGRPNDLIGIVTFARYADTVCPLTLGHDAVAQFLKSVRLAQFRNEDGTAIGDAIALAAARLKTAGEAAAPTPGGPRPFAIKSKVIILLTDGQNNAGSRDPLAAAQLAKDWGIRIYAIGVGGAEGLARQQGIFGSFLVRRGEGVDEATLKAVAEKTGGRFFLAEDGKSLQTVYAEIDRLERSAIRSLRYVDYQEWCGPLLGAALALLALEILLAATVFRRIP